jgi:putative ABC transport system permease protein
MAFTHSRLFVRIIAKNRDVYALKIVSLSVAVATSTLIALFALNEFGYDRFHRDYGSIVRVLQRNTTESHMGNRLSNRIPFHAFARLKAQCGDSMSFSRVKRMEGLTVLRGGTTFQNEKICAADSSISTVFSFRLLAGSLDMDPNNNVAILCLSEAVRFFGRENAVGKQISIAGLQDTVAFTVGGVYKDFPDNSHEPFDLFISFNPTAIRSLDFSPDDTGVYGKTEFPLKAMIHEGNNGLEYILQPLAGIHFGPAVLGDNARHGDRYSIVILISITVLILFLALTTFINLTTLTLPNRSKELAVKKLAGTSQLNLLLTFGVESFAIIAISVIIGLGLLVVASPVATRILSIDFVSLLLASDSSLVLVLAGVSVLLGIGPLFVAFRFIKASPSRLLGTAVMTFPRFKRIIIFLQLGMSMFLIVASMVIKRQIDYSLLKEPGRNYDQIVYLRCPQDLTDEGLRNLRSGWQKYNPNILDVMATSQLPDQINSKEVDGDFYTMSVDPGYRDFFRINMVEGRWFKPNDGDSIVVINESGRALVGKDSHNVIGVFKDISGTFNQPEKPVKIKISPYFDYNFLCIRVLEVDIRRTLEFLSSSFPEGGKGASISFMNKRFEEWLNYQDKLNGLSKLLAIISAVLSCFAILGLTISVVRDKVKQIAIHKLCGADVSNITGLLVRLFAKQMLIAILVFAPLTFMVLKELLRTFVYRTHFIWTDSVVPLAYCGVVIGLLCVLQARSLNRADLSSALKD